MSSEFVVEVPDGIPRALFASLGEGIVWDPEPTRWLRHGRYRVFRPWWSTRATELDYSLSRLAMTIQAGACREDCDLALGIIRAAATYGGGAVRTAEFGAIPVGQLDNVFDDGWKRSQLDSAVRVTVALARDRGLTALPGPTRDVWIGPRMLAELEAAGSAVADQLVAIMRRTLWPDPRYLPAIPFVAPGPTGEPFIFVWLAPGVAGVLPHSDKVALNDGWGTVLIARHQLTDLSITATFLDERNQLVEWINPYEWPQVCAVARTLAG